MTKAGKTFDAVEMMRQLRDDLSRQISDMTFEEEKRYLKEHALPIRALEEKKPEERESDREKDAV